MDDTDKRLVAYLRRDGRAGISEIAAALNITRTTARNRLERLKQSGEIVGFTVLTRSDAATHPVRGLMMLEVVGRGAEKVARTLTMIPQVQAVHSTNGVWDLIAEIGTETLEQFDQVLTDIRRNDGITKSETNLLLSTRR
ncbi:DNA-binding Lrp family transcriptional regulator [Loktanella ponticola]|uniref:DNA-binding Lrp family transcriptional regulator n=1 Tax=Yoonia ponticola TaxID=1524255 RepID=A0A7W9BNS2_9RHOB|nr:Lrp/AsnC family transcriptional regulator [Yoonia ponticola]MBB5723875.1 DNA-binding Lrp family transcriptional regulator [Yoonia ponticola]